MKIEKTLWPALLIAAAILLLIAHSLRYEHNAGEIFMAAIITMLAFLAGYITRYVMSDEF